MKVWMKIIIAVVVLILIAGTTFKLKLKKMEEEVKAEFDKIEKIAEGTLTDGSYTGSYGNFTCAATVAVTVADSKIAKVEITEQKAGKTYKATETVDNIVKAQQPATDAITGATTSSRVIMIATNKALKK